MILPILQYGDPILRTKGNRIEEIDGRIRELAANMIETMHAAHGVGLAAQQIGEALQLTVLDISAVEDRPSTLILDGKEITDPRTAMPLVLINPEIELRGETEVGVEGCLSFPEMTADIERAHSVTVRAQNLEGEPIEIEANGLPAVASTALAFPECQRAPTATPKAVPRATSIASFRMAAPTAAPMAMPMPTPTPIVTPRQRLSFSVGCCTAIFRLHPMRPNETEISHSRVSRQAR